MGRIKKQNNKYSSIVIIIIIIVCLLFTTSNILLYLKYEKDNTQNKLLNNKLETIVEKYDELIKNNEDLKIQKDKIVNLDSETTNLKKEVFSLASLLEEKIQKKETNYKIAYITFDDGPYYSTNKVIEILKDKKVKATFFTIGLDKETCYDNRSQSCSELYKKIVDNGHTIANHTYSHLIFNGLYSNTTNFINQVKKQEELIKDKTGVITNIIRFPGGSGTAGYYGIKNSAIEKLRELNYGWVDWSAQDGDGGNLTSTTDAWNNLRGSINEDIEVILFHDYNNITISILPGVIDYLQEKNYILLPLFYESVKVNK